MVLSPLKDRIEDVPLLVDHFVRRLGLKTGKNLREVSPKATSALCAHDYPGNVRELQNILERIFVLCHGSRIELKDLPEEILRPKAQAVKTDATMQARRKPSERTLLKSPPATPGRRTSEDPIVHRLMDALAANAWDRTKTAQSLGIGRNTLWRRMKEHGLTSSRRTVACRGTRIA